LQVCFFALEMPGLLGAPSLRLMVRRGALPRSAWRLCVQLRQKILLFAIKIGNDLANGVP
jgi:hypothetical protein